MVNGMNKTLKPHISIKSNLFRMPSCMLVPIFAWLPGFPIALLVTYLIKDWITINDPVFFLGGLGLILGPAVGFALMYQLSKKALNKTKYVLGENTISSTSGIFGTTTQNFKYSDIASVTLHQSIGQRSEGVGDISMVTTSETAMRLYNLHDYKDVLNFIESKRS